MTRFIGIQHRVKKTKAGEAHPTRIWIVEKSKGKGFTLSTEQDELDFVHGRFPLTWRELLPNENLESFPEHHRKEDGKSPTGWKVPDKLEGLQSDDAVLMILGGSGDLLAFYASVRAEKISAQVLRTSPAQLKKFRGEEATTDKDAQLLIDLYQQQSDLFYPVLVRDREMILLRHKFRLMMDAQAARIGCGQRLLQQSHGAVFCHPDGEYPQGLLETTVKQIRDNSAVYQALEEEEGKLKNELEKLLKNMPVYQKLFQPIIGVGPMIAARLLVAIGDIRRFETLPAFRKFCGVHVGVDGKFERQKRGQNNNWNPLARQAFYLLVDQFNRRPDSEWGQTLLANKAALRAKHPEVLIVHGKKQYTDGHILKMALWKTAGDFAKWLYREWRKLENVEIEEKSQAA